LPNGTIEFLGRIDTQVKIRGFRVELGGIETVLSQYPGVRECAVTAPADASGSKQLVAYFVSDASVAPTTEDLREHLRRTLPEYMVPAVLIQLDSLPLNANSKVDRKALPSPDRKATDSATRFIAPSDPMEAQLARIWEEVLGIQPIGAADHFFDLGGHSLMAVRLVARIEKFFGRKIPVAAVFQSPTIAQLANVLRAKRETVANSSLVAIQPRGTKPPWFFMHGVGGGMFWGYTNLARYLGADQPVLAFKSRGMDGLDEFDTIEEMAAHYAAELRAFQPEGPYHLGGYCFGGNVAYEVARQLQMQGAEIAQLALINCVPPNGSYHRIRFTLPFCFRFLKNLGYWAGYLRQLNRGQQRDFLFWKLRAIRKSLLRLFKAPAGVSSDIDIEEVVDLSAQPEDRRKLWETHVRALMNHQPKPYAGHVTLFRTRGHSLLCSFDDAYGWRELATGGVTVKIVPGAHESILDEPHVQSLAEVMTQSGRDVQNQSLKKNP
jgi:thioesterase domain-containing protein/acyl carrier protein